MVTATTIIWRRLDKTGHESARLLFQNSRWHLSGTAVFVHDHLPCRLDYLLKCDSEWKTLSGKIEGWVGDEMIGIEISVDDLHRWWLNGEECLEVVNCIDLDLNFSPITNLLPIRRLNLAVGEKADVNAAWLRFPGFNFERLEQIYHRIEPCVYQYESAGAGFVTRLDVNDIGLVTNYPEFWQVEA
jgi:hypothetical protein